MAMLLLTHACLAALLGSLVTSTLAKTGGPLAESANQDGAEKGVVQRLEMQAPTMTEEDQYGYTMPDRYRCDSCRAVMFHLNAALTKQQPKSRRLQEWEYTELFDLTCKHGFTGYGVKFAHGENVLSGPALTTMEPLQPGMGAIQMGGETWEKRLGELCNKYVYDTIGEDELYERFLADGGLSQSLCFETKECHMGPSEAPAAAATSERTRKMDKKSEKAKKAKKDATLDAATFLKKLAAEHGLPMEAYTKKRTWDEWRQTMGEASAKIGEQQVQV